MRTTVLVPMERKKVIDRKVMDELKRKLEVSVKRDKNTVELDCEDGLKLMQAKNIIKGIGRGFSPVRAYKLLDEEEELEVIEIKKRIETIRSRIIGTKGRTREMIEECTGAIISVYGKTISIIGKWKEKENAKKAVEMIIEGVRHKTVYRFLEKLRGK